MERFSVELHSRLERERCGIHVCIIQKKGCDDGRRNVYSLSTMLKMVNAFVVVEKWKRNELCVVFNFETVKGCEGSFVFLGGLCVK